MEGERSDSCMDRCFSAAFLGTGVGLIYGAVAAAWQPEAVAIVGSKAAPALTRTAG